MSASRTHPRQGMFTPNCCFFVAFSVEGDEIQIVVVGELQERARGGDQRRRLIVMAVGGAECPVQARHIERDAEARADGVFRDASRKNE